VALGAALAQPLAALAAPRHHRNWEGFLARRSNRSDSEELESGGGRKRGRGLVMVIWGRRGDLSVWVWVWEGTRNFGGGWRRAGEVDRWFSGWISGRVVLDRWISIGGEQWRERVVARISDVAEDLRDDCTAACFANSGNLLHVLCDFFCR
jgi:hypothetical protein